MGEDDSTRPSELDAQVLHEGETGRFGLHRVRFPDGHVSRLELLRHPGAAAIVPFLDATHIVLLRQYRFAAGGVIWEIPAGKLDPGERPESCALRELQEETGHRAGRLEPLGRILTAPGFTDECIHLFAAHDLEPGPTAHEPSELIELQSMPLERALEMIDRGEIIDAKTIAGLFHVARRGAARA